MRTVKQLAGMQQHYAAVVRKGNQVYVVPQTIRHRQREARAAMGELEIDLQGGSMAVERVFVSWEAEVTVPETPAEVREAKGWPQG